MIKKQLNDKKQAIEIFSGKLKKRQKSFQKSPSKAHRMNSGGHSKSISQTRIMEATI